MRLAICIYTVYALLRVYMCDFYSFSGNVSANKPSIKAKPFIYDAKYNSMT